MRAKPGTAWRNISSRSLAIRTIDLPKVGKNEGRKPANSRMAGGCSPSSRPHRYKGSSYRPMLSLRHSGEHLVKSFRLLDYPARVSFSSALQSRGAINSMNKASRFGRPDRTLDTQSLQLLRTSLRGKGPKQSSRSWTSEVSPPGLRRRDGRRPKSNRRYGRSRVHFKRPSVGLGVISCSQRELEMD